MFLVDWSALSCPLESMKNVFFYLQHAFFRNKFTNGVKGGKDFMGAHKYIVKGLTLLSFTLLAAGTSFAKVDYQLHKSANPTADELDAYSRITAVMDSALYYYNTYTNLSKHINVYYAPGVPTAEASSNGDLRFGENRTYMYVGTAMHEMAHTMGVGTTTEYQSLKGSGVFLGEKAQALLKELDNDPSAELHCDGQHFWPYGLNQKSEVKSEQDLIKHAKIVQAMYQDMFKEAFYMEARVEYMADGKCMGITASKGLEMMDCSGDQTVAKIWSVGDNPVTYRFEFGDRVIDIPNESTAAGIVVGTYSWNGGAHQRYVFEMSPVDRPHAFYLQNFKSKLYLLPSDKNIVQDQRSRDNQSGIWILRPVSGEEPPAGDTTEVETPVDTTETPSVVDTSVVDPGKDSTGQDAIVRRVVVRPEGQLLRQKFDVMGRSVNQKRRQSKYIKLF